jgi:hypothetical protein
LTERICTKTGFALTASPVCALRIARESFGPLDPRPRGSGEDPAGWSRYDTVGRTIYASADRLTAYLELLSPYRSEIDGTRRALQKDADFMGVALDELWSKVVAEWDEAGNMKARWLPRAFREGRVLYNLSFPAGWWVDVSTTETISTINDRFDRALPTGCGKWTTGSPSRP